MATVDRNKFVKAGDWRTLESGWNVTFACIFQDPAGARVKVRYGDGWIFGWDSQKQTLDGKPRTLKVSHGSLAYARVQMKVQQDTNVHYTYVPSGP